MTALKQAPAPLEGIDGQKGGASRKRRTAPRAPMTPGRWLILIALIAAALVMIFPFYWILITALSPSGQAQSSSFYLWPNSVTLENFSEAFSSNPLMLWIQNSLLISIISSCLTLVVSLMAGYAFAKFSFRGRTAIFFAYLLTIMVPIQVTLVPAFLVVVKLGLVNSIWAVILPGAAEATAVFISRQFMLSLPNELLEAARVDGAGEFRIFLRIVVPLSGPLIGVLAILSFMTTWNAFLWPFVVLQGNENLTLPVGLASLQGGQSFATPWGEILAIAAIAVLPVLAVFLIFQRQFVTGIASTGMK